MYVGSCANNRCLSVDNICRYLSSRAMEVADGTRFMRLSARSYPPCWYPPYLSDSSASESFAG